MAIDKSKMFFTDHAKVSGVGCWPFDAQQHPLVCAMLLATTHGSCEHLLQGFSSLKLKDAHNSVHCCESLLASQF
jgi:hypothetical protein